MKRTLNVLFINTQGEAQNFLLFGIDLIECLKIMKHTVLFQRLGVQPIRSPRLSETLESYSCLDRLCMSTLRAFYTISLQRGGKMFGLASI